MLSPTFKGNCAWLAILLTSPLPFYGQRFTSLTSFNGTNGSGPAGALVQGLDGRLYGTAQGGGSSNLGTIFAVTVAGKLTVIHSMAGAEGAHPAGGLMLVPGGTLYGTAAFGGAASLGSVFKLTPDMTLTVVHSFSGPDGNGPLGTLVQAFNGKLYGTASGGGTGGLGAVYAIGAAGAFQTIHNLVFTDGIYPAAGLVQATDGSLYGTTSAGGRVTNNGTVIQIFLPDFFSSLFNFSPAPGVSVPKAALVQGDDGLLYGTTAYGGRNNDGGVFNTTTGGSPTTLHSFAGTDGALPLAALIQGTDGNFYGTTSAGGPGSGTVFQITPGGTLTTLHFFQNSDGSDPEGPLVQATDGDFYGTTVLGGANNSGTLFKISMGLSPFIRAVPSFGKPHAEVTILGTALSDVTSVMFNGTPATFRILSQTAIAVRVPSGAVNGPIQVTMPGATLTSNVNFEVL